MSTHLGSLCFFVAKFCRQCTDAGARHGGLQTETEQTSQTVAALEPKTTPGFDFTPADRLAQRAANRYHHLGDRSFAFAPAVPDHGKSTIRPSRASPLSH